MIQVLETEKCLTILHPVEIELPHIVIPKHGDALTLSEKWTALAFGGYQVAVELLDWHPN